jgi:hypothetical protein
MYAAADDRLFPDLAFIFPRLPSVNCQTLDNIIFLIYRFLVYPVKLKQSLLPVTGQSALADAQHAAYILIVHILPGVQGILEQPQPRNISPNALKLFFERFLQVDGKLAYNIVESLVVYSNGLCPDKFHSPHCKVPDISLLL